jgi:hypothetical protein
VGCPFDVIKTKIQVSSKETFSGPVSCLRWTIRHEKLPGLFRGLTPMMIASTPHTICLFSFYQFLRPVDGNLPQCFFAGALSGLAVTVPMNPFEVWRVRLQAGADRANLLKTFMAKPSLLLRGLHTTAAVNSLGGGVSFFTNEGLRGTFSKNGNFGLPSLLSDAITGAFTGVIVKLVIYPADFLRSRLMANAASKRLMDEVLSVTSKHGIKGLYRGASLVVLRGTAINAAAWPAFHWVKQQLDA